jgi:hypothetical protein
VNPRIAASYAEVAAWLQGFAASHVKRDDPRWEVTVDRHPAGAGGSYTLRVARGGSGATPGASAPIELSYAEVVEGRSRLAWCEALAARLRAGAGR